MFINIKINMNGNKQIMRRIRLMNIFIIFSLVLFYCLLYAVDIHCTQAHVLLNGGQG